MFSKQARLARPVDAPNSFAFVLVQQIGSPQTRDMSFQSVEFGDVSKVTPSFELDSGIRGRVYSRVLIAKFSGEYRPGSSGAPDAYFIYGFTQAAVTLWHPDALLLDFSELSYVWGDEMDLLLAPSNVGNIPTALFGSQQCLPAIGTLVFGIGSTRKAVEHEGIFDQRAAALAFLERKLEAKRFELDQNISALPSKGWGLLEWLRIH